MKAVLCFFFYFQFIKRTFYSFYKELLVDDYALANLTEVLENLFQLSSDNYLIFNQVMHINARAVAMFLVGS